MKRGLVFYLNRMGLAANPYGLPTGSTVETAATYQGVSWPAWTPSGVPKEVAEKAERWMQDVDPCERGAWSELAGVKATGADAALIGSDFCTRELGSRGVPTSSRPGGDRRPLHLTDWGATQDWGLAPPPVVEAPHRDADTTSQDVAQILADFLPPAPASTPAPSPTSSAMPLLAIAAGGLLLFAFLSKKGRR